MHSKWDRQGQWGWGGRGGAAWTKERETGTFSGIEREWQGEGKGRGTETWKRDKGARDIQGNRKRMTGGDRDREERQKERARDSQGTRKRFRTA